ncbi:alpha-1,2-fucosyltransferase [Pedobacter sp.]|uniref:alpha-1,2-fucosyltransferase n=1 Tax=Pedobacter sp. TaxID=1411316 RepID=UPI0031D9738F
MKVVKILGGLGNQMFQYAFYLALANKYNNVKIDISDFRNYELHNGLELENVFDIKLQKASRFITELLDPSYRAWGYRKLRRILNLKNTLVVEQNFFSFDKHILNDPKSRIYWGYWQNTQYFEHVANKIRKCFMFKKPLTGKNQQIAEIISSCESVSIHIRRGDYIGHDLLGGICDLDYYKQAISVIENRVITPNFFIFSNDIEWCEENLNIKDAHYISWNKNNDSYIDMQLMSLCKHNIIANSSFSWWGGWLNSNENKIIISPKKWTNNSVNTLALEEWIKC